MRGSSKVHWPIILVALFTCSTVLLGVVKGNLCSEDMGGCDLQCNTRCEAKHPGGQASCDGPTSTCKCFYQCGEPIRPPPTEGKTCNVGLGPCSAKCYDECCNRKCAERFAGDLGGHGYCYSAIGPARYSACLCYFRC